MNSSNDQNLNNSNVSPIEMPVEPIKTSVVDAPVEPMQTPVVAPVEQAQTSVTEMSQMPEVNQNIEAPAEPIQTPAVEAPVEPVNSTIETNESTNNQNTIIDNSDAIKFVKKKKPNKIILIILIIFIILIIGISCLIFYIRNVYNAEKFLDSINNSINIWINNNLNLSSNQRDYIENFLEYDTLSSGNFELDMDGTKIVLNYSNSLTFNNKYEKLYLDLKLNEEELINGNLILDDNNIYIDSKDLYDNVLYQDLGIDIFSYIIEYKNENKERINIDDFKVIISNLNNYLNQSLKEAECKTSYKGVNVEYKYNINNSNISIIKEKFINLIKSDDLIMKYINEFSMESIFDDINNIKIENFSLTINKNIFNKKINSFILNYDDNIITGNRNNDEFIILDNDYKYIISKKDETYNIDYYENNEYIVTFKIKMVTNDSNFNLDIIAEDKDNKMNIIIEYKLDGNKNIFNLKLNGEIADEDNTSKKSTLNIIFSSDIEYGKNLVNKENITNSVNINDLSYNDLMNIREKLKNIVRKFTILPDIYENAYGIANENSYNTY
ncbi:MAG: hypothetical protein ACI4XR_00655 [Bacilli bacterium]